MAALRVGQTLTIPGLPGKWSVWSLAGGDYGPGAYFVVPTGGSAERYEVIRATQKKNEPYPTITLLSRQTTKGPQK